MISKHRQLDLQSDTYVFSRGCSKAGGGKRFKQSGFSVTSFLFCLRTSRGTNILPRDKGTRMDRSRKRRSTRSFHSVIFHFQTCNRPSNVVPRVRKKLVALSKDRRSQVIARNLVEIEFSRSIKFETSSIRGVNCLLARAETGILKEERVLVEGSSASETEKVVEWWGCARRVAGDAWQHAWPQHPREVSRLSDLVPCRSSSRVVAISRSIVKNARHRPRGRQFVFLFWCDFYSVSLDVVSRHRCVNVSLEVSSKSFVASRRLEYLDGLCNVTSSRIIG